MGFQWTLQIAGLSFPFTSSHTCSWARVKQQGHFHQMAGRKIWYFSDKYLVWGFECQVTHKDSNIMGAVEGQTPFLWITCWLYQYKRLVNFCLSSFYTCQYINLLSFRLGHSASGLTHPGHLHCSVVFWVICVVLDMTCSVLVALYCMWPLDPCCFRRQSIRKDMNTSLQF